MAQERNIDELLASHDAFITYVPLRTEVPFRDYVSLPGGATLYEIQPRAALDPHKEAANARASVAARRTAILIPGRVFDASGTRHGQGGGWYDRFLAEVPREWLRIGFCYEAQLSPTPLAREAWDQEMDIVCVVEDGKLVVYEANV